MQVSLMLPSNSALQPIFLRRQKRQAGGGFFTPGKKFFPGVGTSFNSDRGLLGISDIGVVSPVSGVSHLVQVDRLFWGCRDVSSKNAELDVTVEIFEKRHSSSD